MLTDLYESEYAAWTNFQYVQTKYGIWNRKQDITCLKPYGVCCVL